MSQLWHITFLTHCPGLCKPSLLLFNRPVHIHECSFSAHAKRLTTSSSVLCRPACNRCTHGALPPRLRRSEAMGKVPLHPLRFSPAARPHAPSKGTSALRTTGLPQHLLVPDRRLGTDLARTSPDPPNPITHTHTIIPRSCSNGKSVRSAEHACT